MKVKVIKKFREKDTGSVCMAGLVLDITEERFNEINSSGVFLEKVEEKKTTKK